MIRKRQKIAGVDFTVETKSKPRSGLPSLRPDVLKQALNPLADRVPSNRVVHHGEILPPEPTTLNEYVEEISRLYMEVQNTFLRIGELLERAEQELSKEDYMTLAASLPFGKSARSQLRQAYKAVQDGVVPREMAERGGYTTVYLIASLPETQRRLAIEEGIIRPDTRREEVVAFKRRVKEQQTDRSRVEKLTAERARLQAQINRLQARVSEISAEIEAFQEISD